MKRASDRTARVMALLLLLLLLLLLQ